MQSGAIRPLNNMLPRNLFNAEHEAFRETVRKFYAKEVVPNIEKYEQQQHVDRELWNKARPWGYCVPPCLKLMVVRCRPLVQYDFD
jgi:long-chain-acyl-CoA dehydrogenase